MQLMGALLRIDGTKKGDMPTTKFMSIREIIPQLATGTGGTGGGTFHGPGGGTFHGPGGGTVHGTDGSNLTSVLLDKDGISIPFKMTGKSVALTTGKDHENGQRYSVNHNFQNYIVIGYFKTGKGQEQIEMKTDGPNHGGCSKLPDCCWAEVDLAIQDRTNDTMKYKAGQFLISSEWPHPKNHLPPENQGGKILTESLAEKWIGFGVAGWQDGEFRHLQGYADPHPFDATRKARE